MITYTSCTGISSLKDCPAKAAFGRIADRVLGEKVNLVLSHTKKEKPRRKKPFIIGLSIFFVLIICFCAVFATDFLRCKNFKAPVFARNVSTDESGTAVYSAGIYKCDVTTCDGRIVKTAVYVFGRQAALQEVVYCD